MQIMGRRAEGWPTIADYTVWTNELSREELMIIIDGIRNHRINQAKRKLQFLRAQRDLHRGYGRMRNKQINQKPIKVLHHGKSKQRDYDTDLSGTCRYVTR